MKYVISRFNHGIGWLSDYSADYVLYDRSTNPLPGAIVVPNIGSDVLDKLSFIIDNYDNLPDVAVYTKANLFDYIRPKEFELLKDNQLFTPLFSKFHPETMIDLDAIAVEMIPRIAEYPEKDKPLFYRLNMIGKGGAHKYSFYDEEGMYNELNVPAYLAGHNPKSWDLVEPLMKLLGIWDQEYIKFAPGSNYILPKENILKHPKQFYEELRSYLDWSVYPGECMIIERGLYNIWVK